jgi:hypothetical protein
MLHVTNLPEDCQAQISTRMPCALTDRVGNAYEIRRLTSRDYGLPEGWGFSVPQERISLINLA